jgi:hypothetical protein
MDSQSVEILASYRVVNEWIGGSDTYTDQPVDQPGLAEARIEVVFDVFDDDEPGCRTDTNVVGVADPVLRYLRLKVKNSGRSTALGVFACVTKLTFTVGVGRGGVAPIDQPLTTCSPGSSRNQAARPRLGDHSRSATMLAKMNALRVRQVATVCSAKS